MWPFFPSVNPFCGTVHVHYYSRDLHWKCPVFTLLFYFIFLLLLAFQDLKVRGKKRHLWCRTDWNTSKWLKIEVFQTGLFFSPLCHVFVLNRIGWRLLTPESTCLFRFNDSHSNSKTTSGAQLHSYKRQQTLECESLISLALCY